MDILESMHEHFHYLFNPLIIEEGRFFMADHLPRLAIEDMNRIFQLELWDCALENRATQAYHNLAILTNDVFLIDALNMAVTKHEFWAIASIAARIARLAFLCVLPFVECKEKCPDCNYIRDALVDQIPLRADWSFVRQAQKESRRKNLYGLQRPYMLFSPKTDVILKRIERANKNGWNCVLAACVIIRMWREWQQRQLIPASTFIRKLSLKRWEVK